MKKGFIGAWIGSMAVIIAYGAYEFYKLSKSKLELIHVQIKEFSIQKLRLVLNMELVNSSDLSAEITEQHYVVSLSGVDISTINVEGDRIHLNSNGRTLIPIDVNINTMDTLKTGLNNLSLLVGDKSKIIVGVRGHLTLKAGNLVTMKNYPINEKFTLQELLDVSKKRENKTDRNIVVSQKEYL